MNNHQYIDPNNRLLRTDDDSLPETFYYYEISKNFITRKPTTIPTTKPTRKGYIYPTRKPTNYPPTHKPTYIEPTHRPTGIPTDIPTERPTLASNISHTPYAIIIMFCVVIVVAFVIAIMNTFIKRNPEIPTIQKMNPDDTFIAEGNVNESRRLLEVSSEEGANDSIRDDNLL